MTEANGAEKVSETVAESLRPPGHHFEFHPLCSAFPLMIGDEFAELVADIKQHGQRDPVTLYRGEILDGRNRCLACQQLGIGVRAIEREIDDPVAFVISVNVRRRHLSNEQRRDLIARLLQDDPTRSDRATAKLVGVDHKTVASVRNEAEVRGEIPHVARRTDSKGRQQPAKKHKAAARHQVEARDPNDKASVDVIPFTKRLEPSSAAPSMAKALVTAPTPLSEGPDENCDAVLETPPSVQAVIAADQKPVQPPIAEPSQLDGDRGLLLPRDAHSLAKLLHDHWPADECRRLIAELQCFFPEDRDRPTTIKPIEGDDFDAKDAGFFLNSGLPHAIANRLFQELPRDDFREVVSAVCEIWHNAAVRH